MKPLGNAGLGLVGLALLLGAAARAEAPAADESERERIRTERAAAEASYAQQVQLCGKKFLATSCIDAARAQRHAADARLDKQQQALDEIRRAQRASERLQAIDSKSGGEAARRRDEAARERSANRRDGVDPKRAAAPASAAPPRSPRAASSGAERAEQEARTRRAYELKQLHAEAHRQEVARRNEERTRKAGSGTPLPTPQAASAAESKTNGGQR